MKILQWGLIGLGVLVGILVIVGLFLPSSVHVERAVVIEAPPVTIFTALNGYDHMNEWSPWAQRDPETRYTYSGPSHGVGAGMAWESEHPDVGNGNQVITVSEPLRRIETALDFGPQGTATAFYELTPEGGGTRVVWGFDTDFGMNLIGRYMGLMFETWLGGDYEAGLANLKQYAEEKLPKEDWTDLEIEQTEVEAQTIAYVSSDSEPDAAAIGQALGDAYGKVMGFVASSSLTPVGQPLTITTTWGDRYEFDAGIPIDETTIETSEDAEVQIAATYAGPVVKAVHIGPYTNLETTYEKVSAYMVLHGLEAADRSWDVWISDPAATPEPEWITHVYYPVRR